MDSISSLKKSYRVKDQEKAFNPLILYGKIINLRNPRSHPEKDKGRDGNLYRKMSFQRILGQDQPKRIIQNALQGNSVAHAYLFYGQESIGKKLTAIELAKALNCEVSGPEGGCDDCPSCRKIDQRIHPDFFLLEPEKSSPSGREAVIKVEEVRELQKKLSYLPYEGKTKVAIIDGTESMNPQSANTFLKTLEEPPSATVLILITQNPYRLLPTIVSRCQGVKFHPLTSENVKQILKQSPELETGDLGEEELALRALRSKGGVRKALEEDMEATQNYREEVLTLIEKVSFDQMHVVFKWTRQWAKQPAQIQSLLDEMLNLLRDLAVIKSRGSNTGVLNQDILDRLQPLAAQKSVQALVAMFDSVLRTKSALTGNANLQLSLDHMLIEFCEAA
ncbi:MAG: DNA polymerase III subunit delta' [Nitrospinaceae bacterium]|nr:MAG: DNA polymerase III subunit delta' [Nitrospinaceae bacterium]